MEGLSGSKWVSASRFSKSEHLVASELVVVGNGIWVYNGVVGVMELCYRVLGRAEGDVVTGKRKGHVVLWLKSTFKVCVISSRGGQLTVRMALIRT